jgi:hypothetical protein
LGLNLVYSIAKNKRYFQNKLTNKISFREEKETIKDLNDFSFDLIDYKYIEHYYY